MIRYYLIVIKKATDNSILYSAKKNNIKFSSLVVKYRMTLCFQFLGKYTTKSNNRNTKSFVHFH